MNDMKFFEEAGRHEKALDIATSANNIALLENENDLSLATEEEILAISQNKYGSGEIHNRKSTAAVGPAADSKCTVYTQAHVQADARCTAGSADGTE
eukprot:9843075-Karenia_brevis.AAC.1